MDEKFLRDGIAYVAAVIERIGETAKGLHHHFGFHCGDLR